MFFWKDMYEELLECGIKKTTNSRTTLTINLSRHVTDLFAFCYQALPVEGRFHKKLIQQQ
jgi:hypothetical protein